MDLSSAELLFEPSSRRCFVLVGEGARSVDSMQDMLVLSSYLPLRICERDTRPQLQGKARLMRHSDNGHALQLFNPQGEATDEPQLLKPAIVSSATAEWSYGLYSDRWMDCDAELEISEAHMVGLRLFLPERVGLIGKWLTVQIDGEDVSHFEVDRGMISEHWVTLPEGLTEACRLAFRWSYEEPISLSSDQRSLGAVMVQMNLDRMGWKEVVAS